MENEFKINKLKTPTHSLSSKLSFKESLNNFEIYKSEFKTQDRCKIHLAELYTSNKKIEKLNKEIEEKIKSETVIKNQIDEMKISYSEKIKNLESEIEEQKEQVLDLNNKNKILELSHNHVELIKFYENKIDEYHERNTGNIEMFTQMLNKLNMGVRSINNNNIWRKYIKKFENKFLNLERQIAEYSKKERKIYSRQKFFENYCSKAEEKMGHFSKVSKKFYDQENRISQLRLEIETYLNENKNKTNEAETLNKQIKNLKQENENFKKFVDKIKPIIKIDWNEIKSNNEENFERLINNSRNEDFNYNNKNIIILIENLKNLINIIQESTKEINQDFPDLQNVINTVDDIKYYIVMLLKKIQVMTINQYHIVNTCCDLNEKMVGYAKNNKVNFDFLSILKDLRNSCSKLLFELNPK